MTTEVISKITQLYDLLSVRLRSLVEFRDVPFKTILLNFHLLAPEFQCVVSDDGPLHHQYSALGNHLNCLVHRMYYTSHARILQNRIFSLCMLSRNP